MERETAELLKKTMRGEGEDLEDEEENNVGLANDESFSGRESSSTLVTASPDPAKATFSSIEYSERDVPPNIVPNRDTMQQPRRSICQVGDRERDKSDAD